MTLQTSDFMYGESVGQPIAPIPPISIMAFCCTPEVKTTFEQVQRSRHLARARMTVAEGGIEAAMAACAAEGPPHLLVIETDAAMQPMLAQLDALADLCDPETRVVIIGGSNDIALYRALLRMGISDYLPRPLWPEHLIRSLSDITGKPGAVAKGPVIACLGSSGGVGSSTVALNTAWLLGQTRNGIVNLIDLDLDFGTAGLALAMDGARGVSEAVGAGSNLDGQLLDGLFESYDPHLRVLATSDHDGLSNRPTPEVLDHLTDLARGGGQRVVLDLPGFSNAMTRRAVQSADRIILTTTPDLAGLKNTRKLLDLIAALRPDEPAPFVVLNRHGMAKKQEIAARDFAQTLAIELTATLAFDPKGFAHATNLGKVFAATPAGKSAASALQPLVAALTSQTAPAPKAASKPLLARLFRRG